MIVFYLWMQNKMLKETKTLHAVKITVWGVFLCLIGNYDEFIQERLKALIFIKE